MAKSVLKQDRVIHSNFVLEKPEEISDTTGTYLVESFLEALNSGNRGYMQSFIVKNYDPRVLKMLPLYMVVSMNTSFYYESGGQGFELLQILPATATVLSAQLFNNLTGACVLFQVPTTTDSPRKINQLLKMEPIPPPSCSKSLKKLNDSEMVRQLETGLNKMVEDEEFSGTVLLAKNGKPLFQKAFGLADKSHRVSNQLDTKFNIASVGKMFTGTAIVQLAENGKLSFDDPISKYVSADWLAPEFSQKIRIKHLLTHTSGLGSYFKEAYQRSDILAVRTLEDHKKLVANDSLLFEPGAMFFYSNTGMILLGVVIESVSNQSYFDYLEENIFKPAGMKNTAAIEKDVPVLNRATGYTKEYENGKVIWRNNHFSKFLKGSPSGGIYSTVGDLLKFDIAIRSNKLLGPAYSKILLEPKPEVNSPFHSYGFFNYHGDAGLVVGHSGDGTGINAHFKSYHDLGYTIVVLANYNRPASKTVESVISQLILNRAIR